MQGTSHSGVKYVLQRPPVCTSTLLSSLLTRESLTCDPVRELGEKMGGAGEEEPVKKGNGRGGSTGGGAKKIAGVRKQQQQSQLLEIPEEGGLSTSLTDDYLKAVPRLKVEWPVDGDDDEEEGGVGRRMPRYYG